MAQERALSSIRLRMLTALWALFVAAAMLTISVAQSTPQPSSSELVVKVSGLRNSKGVVGVALFNTPAGFPEASDQALQAKNAEIRDGSTEVVFRDLPPGTYAVSVRHDENQNGKLDRNFLGVPKEGYGASNNPRLKRRAPKFEESKFDLRVPRQTIEIKMQY